MILSTSRTTLFPYTTLFRSPSQRDLQADNGGESLPSKRLAVAASQLGQDPDSSGARPDRTVAESEPPAAKLPEWRGWQDRKSTRLNSSHSSISYAVFCLKKN